MTLIKVIIAWAIVAVVLIGGPHAFGGCHHLFKAHHVQQVVAAPQVYYFAGQAIQDESLIRKAIRAEAPAILREALQQLQAPQAQQQVTGVTEGASRLIAFSRKCTTCHTGDNKLTNDDGTLDPLKIRAFARMAGLGKDIPDKMKAVIAGLTPEEKGSITEALISLPPAKPGESGVLSLRTKPDLQRFPLPPPDESGVLR